MDVQSYGQTLLSRLGWVELIIHTLVIGHWYLSSSCDWWITARVSQSTRYRKSLSLSPTWRLNSGTPSTHHIPINVHCTIFSHFHVQLVDWGWLIEHGFTSAPTQYRLYGRRFLQVWWPNQQCQSTEGGWLVIETGLNLTMLTSPCYRTTTCMQILYKKII